MGIFDIMLLPKAKALHLADDHNVSVRTLAKISSRYPELAEDISLNLASRIEKGAVSLSSLMRFSGFLVIRAFEQADIEAVAHLLFTGLNKGRIVEHRGGSLMMGDVGFIARHWVNNVQIGKAKSLLLHLPEDLVDSLCQILSKKVFVEFETEEEKDGQPIVAYRRDHLLLSNIGVTGSSVSDAIISLRRDWVDENAGTFKQH